MQSDYLKQEARAAIRFHHLAVMLGCLIATVGISFLLPTMPESIYRFFKKVFSLNNWTEIILINDFTGVFFALFWVGVVDLLRVYVLPKEEGYLGLLLAKPLSRTQYLFARALPVFTVIFVMGIVLSLFLPLKIALINGAADLHLARVVCAGLVTTALVLALLALLNLIFLFAGETYYAVLLAFLLFALVVLPSGVYVYRPDIFQFHTALRDLFVFPGNLLWHGSELLNLMPLILFVSIIGAALLLLCGGWRLKKMELG